MRSLVGVEFLVAVGGGDIAFAEGGADAMGVGVGAEGDLGGAGDAEELVAERVDAAVDGGGGAAGDGDAVAGDVAGDGAEVTGHGDVETRGHAEVSGELADLAEDV